MLGHSCRTPAVDPAGGAAEEKKCGSGAREWLPQLYVFHPQPTSSAGMPASHFTARPPHMSTPLRDRRLSSVNAGPAQPSGPPAVGCSPPLLPAVLPAGGCSADKRFPTLSRCSCSTWSEGDGKLAVAVPAATGCGAAGAAGAPVWGGSAAGPPGCCSVMERLEMAVGSWGSRRSRVPSLRGQHTVTSCRGGGWAAAIRKKCA